MGDVEGLVLVASHHYASLNIKVQNYLVCIGAGYVVSMGACVIREPAACATGTPPVALPKMQSQALHVSKK